MDTSAISGTVVGVAGITLAGWTQWSNTRLQRQLAAERSQHERQLAHDARVYDSKRDIYIETLVFLNRLDLFMHLTVPIIGPLPDPRELPSDTEEGLLRSARLRAFGSSEVYDAVLDFNKKWAGFRAAVFTLRSLEAQGPRVLEHAIEQQQTQMIEAGMQLRVECTEARARLERVEPLINAELTTP
jgi:hypothetical protein